MKQTHSLVPSARKEVLYDAVRLLSVRKLRLVICAFLQRPVDGNRDALVVMLEAKM